MFEEIYETIKTDFQKLLKERDYQDQRITFIPVSALKGDNIVHKSKIMSWYNGETLLEHLEALDFKDIYNVGTPRFPVQCVIRPKTDAFHDFRGYAGKVYGGELSIGDTVLALPSKTKTKIKSIYFYDEEVQTASRRSSVTITLEDEINISRGDMITKTDNLPTIDEQFTATIAWMDRDTLTTGNKYVIQTVLSGVKKQSISLGLICGQACAPSIKIAAPTLWAFSIISSIGLIVPSALEIWLTNTNFGFKSKSSS